MGDLPWARWSSCRTRQPSGWFHKRCNFHCFIQFHCFTFGVLELLNYESIWNCSSHAVLDAANAHQKEKYHIIVRIMICRSTLCCVCHRKCDAWDRLTPADRWLSTTDAKECSSSSVDQGLSTVELPSFSSRTYQSDWVEVTGNAWKSWSPSIDLDPRIPCIMTWRR